jgi:glutamate--cysteine ligase
MKPTDQISTETDFTRYFAENGRSVEAWSIGVEIEHIGFKADSFERIDNGTVQKLIREFPQHLDQRKSENDFVLEAALKLEPGSRMTIEPGGQIEFSDAPKQALAEIEQGLKNYLLRLRDDGARQGAFFIAAGFDPLRGIDEQYWIPKRRYDIMRPYLARRGRRAWDMMCRTAAIQINLDYSDLEDLAGKFALASRLAPVAAAMFANSPFADGKLSGYRSTRYAAWLETDPDRTGAARCVIDSEFTIACFIEYITRVPMFLIRRDEQQIDLAGYDFNRFLARGVDGHRPIFQDFTDHLSTIFTEARLKPYIEQRSMDCGQLDFLLAAAAFWKGLLYDREALNQALAIAPRMSRQQYSGLQMEVARQGLQAKFNRIEVGELAKQAVELARGGLQRLAPDEAKYLDILEQLICREQICPADILIRNFSGRWHHDIHKALDYLRLRVE